MVKTPVLGLLWMVGFASSQVSGSHLLIDKSLGTNLPDTCPVQNMQDFIVQNIRHRFKETFEKLYEETLAVYSNTSEIPRNIGEPFPRIPGPDKSDRIAVVGAGPAGMHMAFELKKRGFTNVTVYEKLGRTGGKSTGMEYHGVFYTMSIYLLNEDYKETVKQFMIDNDLYETFPFTPVYRLQNNYSSTPIKNLLLYSLEKTQHSLSQFFAAVQKYVRLHRELFGIYEGELMRRPTKRTLKQLQGSFYDFLVRNDLHALEVIFDAAFAMPAYGRVRKISAIHGLLWMTPRNLVIGDLGKGKEAVRTKGGFNDIFNKMIKLQDIDIKFNHEGITKRSDSDKDESRAKIILDFVLHKSEVFDFVVWAGLTSDFARLSYGFISSPEHSEVFGSSFYKSAIGAVVNLSGDIRAHTTEVYLANVLHESGYFNNRVCGSLDFRAEVMPHLTDDTHDKNMKTGVKTRTLSVLLSGDTWEDNPDGFIPTNDQIRNEIKNFFENGFNATDVEVLAFTTHQYFPQWSIKNIGRGFHWKLFEMQGSEKVWFTGGGASFESTKSVMEYNKLLLKQANSEK